MTEKLELAAGPAASAPCGRRTLVVCVDDDRSILSALTRAFRRENLALWVTEAPLEALAWVAGEQVELLIADQRMPLMSGLELLRRVKERSPATKTAILTGTADAAVFSEARRLGVALVITKPWDDGELRLAVGGLVQGRKEEP